MFTLFTQSGLLCRESTLCATHIHLSLLRDINESNIFLSKRKKNKSNYTRRWKRVSSRTHLKLSHAEISGNDGSIHGTKSTIERSLSTPVNRRIYTPGNSADVVGGVDSRWIRITCSDDA